MTAFIDSHGKIQGFRALSKIYLEAWSSKPTFVWAYHFFFTWYVRDFETGTYAEAMTNKNKIIKAVREEILFLLRHDTYDFIIEVEFNKIQDNNPATAVVHYDIRISGPMEQVKQFKEAYQSNYPWHIND